MSTPSPWMHVKCDLFKPTDTDSRNRGLAVVQTAANVIYINDCGGTVTRVDTSELPPTRTVTFPPAWSLEECEAVMDRANAVVPIAARLYVRQLQAMKILTGNAWVEIGLDPYTDPEEHALVAHVAQSWDRIAILAQDLIDARGGTLTNPWMPPQANADAS